MPKTSFFQRVKDLAERKEELNRELAGAVYDARHREAIPLDTLAEAARVSRSTVKNMLTAEEERRAGAVAELSGVRSIDLDMLDDAVLALIAHALKPESSH